MNKELLSPFPTEREVVGTQRVGAVFKFPQTHRGVRCCTAVSASVDTFGPGTQGPSVLSAETWGLTVRGACMRPSLVVKLPLG